MNKQRRGNRGRQASGTVTRPGQGRRSPRPFIPVPPPRPGPRAARTPACPSRLPADRGVHADPLPPHAHAQDEGPGKKAAATRRQLGHLPSPDALHHQWRCVRPAPGKVGDGAGGPRGWGPPGSGRGGGRPRGQGPGLQGLPSRDLGGGLH